MLNNLLKKIIKSGAGRMRYVLAMAGLGIALLLILSAIQFQRQEQGFWILVAGQETLQNTF